MLPPHRRNSFSYKTINEDIKKILDERSVLDNTVQVAMPFIKVTSTIDMARAAGYETETGNYGFTLGMHAIDQDVEFQDIYSEVGTGEYLIGYTYTPDGRSKRIYTPPRSAEARMAIKIFNSGEENLTDPEDGFTFIPPPGITSATIGRNRNGVISIAEISFSVPTLQQLEALHRTFLIPSINVIVEWGQQFANKPRVSYGETGLNESTVNNHMFPWYDRDKLNAILPRIGKNEVGLEEIMQNYVYPTQGQYQWMYGKVANFSIKSTGASFECTMKIVGPSEDSFAYSTRNTVSPPKIKRSPGEGGDGACADKSNSVETYFSATVNGKNLKTLIEKTLEGKGPPNWDAHVKKIEKEQNFLSKVGRVISAATGPVGTVVRTLVNKIPFFNKEESEEAFGDSEDTYLFTWRFFVNIVLNDDEWGIKSIFKDAALTDDELRKVSILRPYRNPGQDPRDALDEKLTDPYENFVGNSKYLRSTDPSALVIVNEKAVELAIAAIKKIDPGLAETVYKPTPHTEKFLELGDFHLSTEHIQDGYGADDPDRGFLSTGVWLNHKAVAQAMGSSNTIMGGISNLLQRMNSATNNFWALAIDPSEPDPDDPGEAFNYGIVDINYKESSTYAQNQFLENVHIFNKKIRTKNGVVVGSELSDCSINLDLPKGLFAQIATIGLHQPSDLKAGKLLMGSGPAENGEADFGIDHPKFPDAKDQLRKMFAITSLAQTDEFDKGPDLTAISKAERAQLIEELGLCTSENSQTTANTGGRGFSVRRDGSSPRVRGTGEAGIANAQEQLDQLEPQFAFCSTNCVDREATANAQIRETNQSATFGVPTLPNSNFNQSTISNNSNQRVGPLPAPTQKYITDTPWSAAFISYAMQESGTPFKKSGLHVNYANPIRNGTTPGWQALNPRTTRLQTGDVIVQNRLQNNLTFQSNPWTGASHGDIVTSVSEGSVVAVGGNVSDTVKTKVFPVNSQGALISNNFFVVLRPPQEKVTSIIGIANRELNKWRSNGWVETTPEAFSSIEPYYVACGLVDPNTLRGPSGTIAVAPPPPPVVYTNATFRKPSSGQAREQWPFSANNFNCNRCASIANSRQSLIQQRNALQARLEVSNAADRLAAEFPELENVFRYIEMLPDWMVTEITNSGNDIFSNAFGAAPGTLSIGGDLTLPGINGLRVGELFWIDRIPAFYRVFGAFQVISLEDIIGADGWTTRIHARFNYLGGAWSQASSKLLSAIGTSSAEND